MFYHREHTFFCERYISRGHCSCKGFNEQRGPGREFFEFESIVERGGHNTYRLLLRNEGSNDSELTKTDLLTKGLAFEAEDDDFFAIDVP